VLFRSERESTIDGERVTYSYADLKAKIRLLNLTRPQRKLIDTLVFSAEEAGKRKAKKPQLSHVEQGLFKQILAIMKVYERQGSITILQYKEIEKTIVNLR
jgi:hypothetical protein